MNRFALLAPALAALAVAACTEAPADQPDTQATTPVAQVEANNATETAGADTSPATPHDHADWKGMWVGQEGLFVRVRPTGPHEYQLEMMGETDTDTAVYTGTDAPGGIAFTRNGETELLRKGTADEINLKWVDGDDCLMVQEFEGFCREG